MTDCKTPPLVAAIVLAAGGSTRIGETKQLLPIGEQPMARRVTQVACSAGLAQVIVVLGSEAERVAEVLAGLPVDLIVNEEWGGGLSTSIRAGLRALRPEIQATLMVLADQPGLRPELLTELVARYTETARPIVAPSYQGRRGNPVLIDRSLFPELMDVVGDQGARALMARYRTSIELIEVDDPAVVTDVDTYQDYERLRRETEER